MWKKKIVSISYLSKECFSVIKFRAKRKWQIKVERNKHILYDHFKPRFRITKRSSILLIIFIFSKAEPQQPNSWAPPSSILNHTLMHTLNRHDNRSGDVPPAKFLNMTLLFFLPNPNFHHWEPDNQKYCIYLFTTEVMSQSEFLNHHQSLTTLVI